MKKRTIAAMLLIVMLAGMSCGSDADGAETKTNNTEIEETTSAETEKPFADDLGEYDFGGADCTFLVRETRVTDLFPESGNGEVVNDALYDRTIKLQERFNVNVKSVAIEDSANLWNKTLSGDVMSGSGDYDVVMPDYYWGCETLGLFTDLNTLDEIDFSKPYWCAGWNDNADIDGHIYNAVGYLSLDLVKNNMCVFFDQKLIGDLRLEDPYTLVEDHKWTVDKLREMSDAALSDLNGDGEYDWENDRIGFGTGSHFANGLMYACDVKMITKEDGDYKYTFMNDTFVEKYQKLYDLLKHTESVKFDDCNGTSGMGYNLYPGFKADRILFLGTAIRTTEDMRDMTGDYGIIPYPLYDENQKNYVTYNLGTAYMSVLITAKNPEMSAVMLEAMNAENYKSVIPEYLDTALKGKYSRDEKTAEMIDLVNESAYFDLAFVNASTGTATWIGYQLLHGSENIVSTYEKSRVSLDQKLESLLDIYSGQAES